MENQIRHFWVDCIERVKADGQGVFDDCHFYWAFVSV